MFTTGQKYFIIVLGTVLTVGFYSVGASADIFSASDKKTLLEQLKKEFNQEREIFENAKRGTKSQEINQRYEQGLKLKGKAKQVGDLEAEVIPPTPQDPAEKLAEEIFYARQVLMDTSASLDTTNPEKAKEKNEISETLNKIESIQRDLKDKQRPVEELQKEFDFLYKH